MNWAQKSLRLSLLFHIIHRGDKRLKRARNQSARLQSLMKKISDLFTDEEKKQLSYLGSMLHRKPTEEEAEQQKILDWFVEHGAKGKGKGSQAQNKHTQAEAKCRTTGVCPGPATWYDAIIVWTPTDASSTSRRSGASPQQVHTDTTQVLDLRAAVGLGCGVWKFIPGATTQQHLIVGRGGGRDSDRESVAEVWWSADRVIRDREIKLVEAQW